MRPRASLRLLVYHYWGTVVVTRISWMTDFASLLTWRAGKRRIEVGDAILESSFLGSNYSIP